MSPERRSDLKSLVDHVRAHRGIDLGSYKNATLERRLHKRIQALGLEGYGQYLDHLQASPEEFVPLLDTLFVNVTSFFRDPEAWETLRTEVIPRIVEGATETDPVRVWCAGVASGEEAYTVAMLLAEAMGMEPFIERVKIFATDLDEGALGPARSALYSSKDLENVPEALRDRYFQETRDGFLFHPDLRRTVIFGRHDLLEDAPISRLRLLVCRNTLMYFNREAQGRVLARFHFALRPDGYLFMGKAELLLTRRNLFEPVEGKARLFRKATELSFSDRLTMMAQREREEDDVLTPDGVRLRDLAFDTERVAEIILDGASNLVLANAAARVLLRLSLDQIGRPFRDLDASYKPVELRGPVDRARRERRPVEHEGVEWPMPDGSVRYFDVRVQPLLDSNGVVATKISYQDVTRPVELAAELGRSRRDLEEAYEELQSTNEELETTNEELQSTVEELETTNEELQSTNEELETMNSELQVGNAELRSVNDRLRVRGEELDRARAFVKSILDSFGRAVVALDTDLAVEAWNRDAEAMWGLREEEVEGQPVFSLDVGLPVHELRALMRDCLAGKVDRVEHRTTGHDRKGKPVDYHVICAARHTPDGSIAGVILTTTAGKTEPT